MRELILHEAEAVSGGTPETEARTAGAFLGSVLGRAYGSNVGTVIGMGFGALAGFNPVSIAAGGFIGRYLGDQYGSIVGGLLGNYVGLGAYNVWENSGRRGTVSVGDLKIVSPEENPDQDGTGIVMYQPRNDFLPEEEYSSPYRRYGLNVSPQLNFEFDLNRFGVSDYSTNAYEA